MQGQLINTNPLTIAVTGAGRMGQAIAAGIEARADLQLAGIWQRGQEIEPLVARADVVIDFSLPEATDQILAAVVAAQKPLVSGVSGLTEAQMSILSAAANAVAVVYDRNMSLGIAVLERSVRDAAASLGDAFSVEIAEVHHVNKKDAPSGTALKLGEAIAKSRGEAGTADIKFESERRGEVPGDHEVVMRSGAEELRFSHSVTSRQVFADGAIRAAVWVAHQAPGQYSMQDVLFGDAN